MLKIAIKDSSLLLKIQKIPLFRKFFLFRLDHMNNIQSEDSSSNLTKFFSIGNVTTKHTEANRFSDIDDITASFLTEKLNVIHDIAISDGTTTLDLIKKLKEKSINHQLFVSDKFSKFSYSGNLVIKIFNSNEEFVTGYFFNLLADKHLSKPFFLSRILYYIVKLLPTASNKKNIYLLKKDLQEGINKDEVTYLNYDIFSSKVETQFTFIRCMNLLNLYYFNKEQLLLGISNISSSLREGGVLQVGRTTANHINEVSFYKKKNKKLLLLKSINGGSELEPLIEKNQ